MTLTYDPNKRQFVVKGHLATETTPLREFYVSKRKNSGRTITNVATSAGMEHQLLYYLEAPYSNTGKKSNSVGTMLRGLEELGYQIEITKTQERL